MGRGSSTSGKLGKKAPGISFAWGPVTTYDADGNVIDVKPPGKEPAAFRPKKRRRRRR